MFPISVYFMESPSDCKWTLPFECPEYLHYVFIPVYMGCTKQSRKETDFCTAAEYNKREILLVTWNTKYIQAEC